MTWSLADIPDQTGRTVIVTGANSGLGASTARALARSGARVILACRSIAKGEAAAASMPGQVQVRHLDLADLSTVRRFSDSVDSVDVLVNNAGVMAVPAGRTTDGFEVQFGTNHLGHFALTGLLLPRLSDRVVTVSSHLHRIGHLDLADLNWDRRRYRRWAAYGQAKLANLLFAAELQRRLDRAGSAVRSLAAHPGYAATNLQSHTDSVQDMIMAVGNRLAPDADAGARPVLFAATAPQAAGGQFIGPGGPFGLWGSPAPGPVSRAARDTELAAALWLASENLTGVSFP